jgi:hypothetical protein
MRINCDHLRHRQSMHPCIMQTMQLRAERDHPLDPIKPLRTFNTHVINSG